MTFETWILFALAITVASVSPGPNVLMVVVNTLKYGIKGAVFSILGNIVCLFGVALLAAIGVGAVIATAPIAFTIMKVAGGLYLAWLGFNMIKNSFGKQANISVQTDAEETVKVSAVAIMTKAILVSASNPKSILFLTAIFPQFLNTQMAITPQFTIMFATIISLVSFIHGIYALLASGMRNKPISAKTRRIMARVTGSTFIGLGAGIAFSK